MRFSKYLIFNIVLIILLAFRGSLPIANQKVLVYVNSIMGTRVGTGECSDLIFNAQYYLKKNGVKSTSKKGNKKVMKGDFISFYDAVLESPEGGEVNFLEHHAIIYEVISEKVYLIAHQNHNDVKVVMELRIDLNTMKKGSYVTTHP